MEKEKKQDLITLLMVSNCNSNTVNYYDYNFSLSLRPSSSASEFINQTSRYSTEFVEVEKIGSGGFGAVYKVTTYSFSTLTFIHLLPIYVTLLAKN